MAETDGNRTIQTLTVRYERRVKILRQLATFVREDKGFTLEIIAALRSPGSGMTVFDVIKECFVQQQNEWCTLVELQTATGLSRTTIGQVLYKSHTSKFETRPKQGYKKTREWRLATFAEAPLGADEQSATEAEG